MIAFTGNILLILALLSSISTLIYAKIPIISGNKRYKFACLFGVFQFLFILFSYIILTYGFIISDFSLVTVWQNSETQKPLIYKITGVWGNHEGSMLLWLLILSICLFFIIKYDKKIPRSVLLNAISVQTSIIFAFLLFIIFTSNPFTLQLPAPTDGIGLNTLLQDPGLIIHPPLLYFGYVGYSVLFSYSIAIMLENQLKDNWARWIEKWAYISWAALTLGICIGSWWAYYELGWGGWWFWDPVENASLLPWITGTALMHSLLNYKSTGEHRDWTLLLSILTFSFSLMGTFLVRSGILTSVHSFASDPQRGLWILVIMSLFIILSLVIFLRNLQNENEKRNFIFFRRGTFILINNYLLMVSVFVIFFGMMYPLLLEGLTGHRITVGPKYFNIVIAPIVILIAILMPVGPNLSWNDNWIQQALKRLMMSFVITLSITLAIQILFYGNAHSFTILVLALALWIIIASIVDLLPRNLTEVSFSFPELKRKNLPIMGSRIVHMAFGIMIFGIVYASAFSENRDLKMNLGDKIQIDRFELQYEGFGTNIGQNYDDLQINFSLLKDDKKIASMKPAKRFFRKSGDITTEASIQKYYFDHIYLTVGEVQEQYIYVSASHKPFVRLIWLGGFLMAFGGLCKILFLSKIFGTANAQKN